MVSLKTTIAAALATAASALPAGNREPANQNVEANDMSAIMEDLTGVVKLYVNHPFVQDTSKTRD